MKLREWFVSIFCGRQNFPAESRPVPEREHMFGGFGLCVPEKVHPRDGISAPVLNKYMQQPNGPVTEFQQDRENRENLLVGRAAPRREGQC